MSMSLLSGRLPKIWLSTHSLRCGLCTNTGNAHFFLENWLTLHIQRGVRNSLNTFSPACPDDNERIPPDYPLRRGSQHRARSEIPPPNNITSKLLQASMPQTRFRLRFLKFQPSLKHIAHPHGQMHRHLQRIVFSKQNVGAEEISHGIDEMHLVHQILRIHEHPRRPCAHRVRFMSYDETASADFAVPKSPF